MAQLVRAPPCHGGGHRFKPDLGRLYSGYLRMMAVFFGIRYIYGSAECRRGGTGRRPGLKIPWVAIPVPVRSRSPALWKNPENGLNASFPGLFYASVFLKSVKNGSFSEFAYGFICLKCASAGRAYFYRRISAGGYMQDKPDTPSVRQDEYLIYQPPLKALFLFALPMIIGSLFQQVYNIADSAIVGRFVSQNALAAVGASSALTNVFICIAAGAGTGAAVVVSRRFGSREYPSMLRSIRTSMIFFLIFSIVLGAAGFTFSEAIMRLLHTPEQVMDMAVVYLKVYFAGFPFLFIYNVVASMFNAIGNSRVPLYFLIFSSALNIAMDLYMVIRLHMGVFGAALATLIAQGISAVFSFIVLIRTMRKYAQGTDEKRTWEYFSTSDLKLILSYAVPSVIQQSTVSIGMMLVQSVVNGFGAEALAGFSATARIENLIAVIWVSVGNAVSPFTAQNLGAGKKERITEGFHAALKLDFIFAIGVFLCAVPFARPIAGIFLGSEGTQEAYSVAVGYMRWIGIFSFWLGAKMAMDGVLKGIGKMKSFMAANLCNLTIRVLTAMMLAPGFGIGFVWYAVPVGWAVNLLISHRAYQRMRTENGISRTYRA